MRAMMTTVAIVGLLAGAPALAQTVPTADAVVPAMEQPAPNGVAPVVEQVEDVASFVCSVAGECDEDEAVDDVPLKDAPDTRGFRVARGAVQAAAAGPNLRVSRGVGVRAASTGSMRRTARFGGNGTRRFAASRTPVTVGAARTDLMLTFDYNSASMTRAAEARARGFAQALMMPELRDKRFVIEGHTDARGAREVNIDLSRKRAQAVADFLVSQGVDRNRVEVKGVGPDKPLPGRSATADANRRVEAVLLS